MNRDIFSRHLTHRGSEEIFATDGKQLVELARIEQPDIILTDMSLPALDGKSPR